MLEMLLNSFNSSQHSINTRKDKGKGKMIESPIDTQQFGSPSEDPSDDLMDVEIIASDRYNLNLYIYFFLIFIVFLLSFLNITLE
jgi:hypothetical protein